MKEDSLSGHWIPFNAPTNRAAWERQQTRRAMRQREIVASRIGTYVCTDLSTPKMREWHNASKMYIVVHASDDVDLIAEDANGTRHLVPDSQNGYMTEYGIVFGSPGDVILFLYKVEGGDLYTIVSPFGLQTKMVFRRIGPPRRDLISKE